LQNIDVRKLSYGQKLELMHLIESLRGADSLLDAVPRITPYFSESPTLRPDHLRPAAALYAKAEAVGGVRACVSTPPRMSKTTLHKHGIGWFLARHPTKNVVFVSATAGFARDSARDCMRVAQRFGVKIKKGEARADYWRTEQGGGMFAVGVGGQLTGRGADLLVIDDIEKDRQTADSALQSQRKWDWFRTVPLTRLEPGASIIVNMTRWSPADLIGRIESGEAGEGWEIINLPAIADVGDPIGREPGEALWPERYPLEVLERIRRQIGEHEFASLYLGQPRPRGHAMFEGVQYVGERDLPEILHRSYTRIVCDPAATQGTSSDYSAIVVGSAYIGDSGMPELIVRDVIRRQCTVPQLARMLADISKRYRCNVGVEAVGGFVAVPQILREISPGLNVTNLPAVKDKFTRATPAGAAWNDGRIKLLAGQPWEREFLQEIHRFTGNHDAHDDQVDALAHLYRWTAELLMAPQRGAAPIPRGLAPFG